MSFFPNNAAGFIWQAPATSQLKKHENEKETLSASKKQQGEGSGSSKNTVGSEDMTLTPVMYFDASDSSSSVDSCGAEESKDRLTRILATDIEAAHQTKNVKYQPKFEIKQNNNEPVTLKMSDDSDEDDDESSLSDFNLKKITLDDESERNDYSSSESESEDDGEEHHEGVVDDTKTAGKRNLANMFRLNLRRNRDGAGNSSAMEDNEALDRRKMKLSLKRDKEIRKLEVKQLKLEKEWAENQLNDWKSITQNGEMLFETDLSDLSDDSIELTDFVENLQPKSPSATTLGKKKAKQSKENSNAYPKLISIDRDGLELATDSSELLIKDLVPKHMLNENPIKPPIAPRKTVVFGTPNVPKQNVESDRWAIHKHMNPDVNTIQSQGGNQEILCVTESNEFDCLVKERFEPLPKKIDYDALEEPPRLNYGWGEQDKNDQGERDKNDNMKEELVKYRSSKTYNQNLQGATNPFDIPMKRRETIQQYTEAVNQAEPSSEQASIIQKLNLKGRLQRIRRARNEGSYPWNSVDEDEMLKNKQNILRFTWKGKLPKLTKYLKDPKNHNEINIQDTCGRSALHFAASWDCAKTLQVLLNVPRVDVNLQDDEGKTALYKAVESNSFECVKLLIEHEAQPSIKAYDNRNPFEYCLEVHGDSALEIIRYLYLEGGMRNERKTAGKISHLHQVCLAKNDVPVLNTAKILIEGGVNVNATEGMGMTPLILATQLNKPDLVELFLEYKADVRHVDLKHKSAISYARPGETCYNLIKGALNKGTKY